MSKQQNWICEESIQIKSINVEAFMKLFQCWVNLRLRLAIKNEDVV